MIQQGSPAGDSVAIDAPLIVNSVELNSAS
jgi:hypothetical protein